VAVAQTLHFRRAAEELHLTQPALSRQIQALETQLGIVLLQRDRRTVALTKAGRQLLEDAVPLLAAADAARRRAQRASRGPDRLVVGFRAGLILTDAIRRFTELHPEVTVDTRRIDWDEQETAVLSGQVDIAYVRRPVVERGLRLIPLFTEPRLAALPAAHPLADEPSLTMAAIAAERHLHFLDPVNGSSGRLRLRSVEEKLEFVASGDGIIVLPLSATAHYTRPDITYVPLTDAEPDEVLLACEASRRSKLLTAFIDSARRAVQPRATPSLAAAGQRG
jgi:DNA-binding transcriptional LysR family regulator